MLIVKNLILAGSNRQKPGCTSRLRNIGGFRVSSPVTRTTGKVKDSRLVVNEKRNLFVPRSLSLIHSSSLSHTQTHTHTQNTLQVLRSMTVLFLQRLTVVNHEYCGSCRVSGVADGRRLRVLNFDSKNSDFCRFEPAKTRMYMVGS